MRRGERLTLSLIVKPADTDAIYQAKREIAMQKEMLARCHPENLAKLEADHKYALQAMEEAHAEVMRSSSA